MRNLRTILELFIVMMLASLTVMGPSSGGGGSSGGDLTSVLGMNTPNAQVIQTNYQAWNTPTNSWGTNWGVPTGGNYTSGNGWSMTEVFGATAGQISGTNRTLYWALAMKTNGPVLPSGANGRFVTSVTIGPLGEGNDVSAIGWETNSGASDNSYFAGFGFNQSSSFALYRSSGSSTVTSLGQNGGGSGVGTAAAGVTYPVFLTADPSNFNCSVVYPGFTNLVLMQIPLTGLNPGGLPLTNLSIVIWGTNTSWGNIGGRIGPQTINPRTGVEGQTICPISCVDSHVGPGQSLPDQLFIWIPPNCDSGTNIPNLVAVFHGNTGTAISDYENAVPDFPTNNDCPANFYSYICTNGNNIILWYYGDSANGGRADTWNTTNSQYVMQQALSYVKQRWPWQHLFAVGESAGGASAQGFVATHVEKVCGLDLNHAVGSISNTYNAGINTSDINTAYGGSTVAEVATGPWWGDPYGFPATTFAGVPVRCESSFGDTIVVKTNQTDLLVAKLGGMATVTNATYFNEIITTNSGIVPEVDDVGVDGPGGVHGGQCFTVQMAQSFLAWQQRCIGYENASSQNLNFGVVTNTLAIATTGVTNLTPHVYLLCVTGGSSISAKDQYGTVFLSGLTTNNTVTLRPGWAVTGTSFTGIATELLP